MKNYLFLRSSLNKVVGIRLESRRLASASASASASVEFKEKSGCSEQKARDARLRNGKAIFSFQVPAN